MFNILFTAEFETLSEHAKTRMEYLWEKYRLCIKSVVLNIVSDYKFDADEVVMETFCKFMSHYEEYSYMKDEEVQAFLITVARNHTYDKLRKEGKITFISTTYTDCDGDETEYDFEDITADVEKLVMSSETVKLIEQATYGLEQKYYEVLTLRLFVELDYKQIAESLNISETLARKRYERGLKLLRRELEGKI